MKGKADTVLCLRDSSACLTLQRKGEKRRGKERRRRGKSEKKRNEKDQTESESNLGVQMRNARKEPLPLTGNLFSDARFSFLLFLSHPHLIPPFSHRLEGLKDSRFPLVTSARLAVRRNTSAGNSVCQLRTYIITIAPDTGVAAVLHYCTTTYTNTGLDWQRPQQPGHDGYGTRTRAAGPPRSPSRPSPLLSVVGKS